jgi:predicted cation transporter
VLRRVIAGFLALHGFAHLVGFLAAWRLGEYAGAPHATLILNGTLDVGDVGIRFVGVVWLVAGMAFFIATAAFWRAKPWAVAWTGGAVILSLVMCVIGLPASIIGLGVNTALLVGIATLAVTRPTILREAVR